LIDRLFAELRQRCNSSGLRDEVFSASLQRLNKAQITVVSQIVQGISGSSSRTRRLQECVLGVKGAGSDVEWQLGKR
jgi:hypothetical protein